MATPTSVPALPLRRNGKPQSCEPCRKGKAACGHELPTCNRCAKRGITSQCVYHPAPLTRLPSLPSPGDGARIQKRTAAGARTSPSLANSWASNTVSNLLFLVNQQAEGTSDVEISSSEFLGPTSFSAVFKDNQASIGEDLLGANNDDDMSPDPSGDQEQWWKAERLSLGIGILKHFPDRQLCARLLTRHVHYCDVELHIPSMKYCLESIWSTYGNFLAEPRSPDVLSTLVQTLLRNGLKPVPHCRSTGEWLESFTGQNLRWEILGTFFAVFGLAVMTMPDWGSRATPSDSLKPWINVNGLDEDRRKYAHKMSECTEACLILCDDSGAVNEFVIWLMHHIHTLNSYYSGDASVSPFAYQVQPDIGPRIRTIKLTVYS